MKMDLHQHKMLYVDMLSAKQQGAWILYEDEEAILIQDQHSEIYYCAAKSKEAANRLKNVLPRNFEILVSHDKYCNEIITRETGIHYENRCYHCAYLSNKSLPIDLPQGYTIQDIHEAYMEDVIELYRTEMPSLANEEYMGLCMAAGMYGVMRNKELCGFISVHEGGYGSIGMLEIKPQYRRKGLGIALERYMINVQLQRGKIPYGEIFMENKASLYLQEKVGMQIGSELTYWFYQ